MVKQQDRIPVKSTRQAFESQPTHNLVKKWQNLVNKYIMWHDFLLLYKCIPNVLTPNKVIICNYEQYSVSRVKKTPIYGIS